MLNHRCKQFGLLCYPGTDNLGDEIQSLAARRFVPRVTRYLNREALNEVRASSGHVYWTIMNGWYAHLPKNWPPSPAVRPLFVSIHITNEPSGGMLPSDIFLAEPVVRYLRAAGPIGARDISTLAMLRNAKVESYFSGCLTLTLQRPHVPRDKDLIVLNDLPDEIVEFIKRRSKASNTIIRTTHSTRGEQDSDKRFARAQELIATYARASCVVTSRLHCALPSLAIGTPVLFVARTHDQYRFSGLQQFVHNCDPDDLLSGRFAYDVDSPPQNKTDHLFYRAALEKSVKEFVDQVEVGNELGWYPSFEELGPG